MKKTSLFCILLIGVLLIQSCEDDISNMPELTVNGSIDTELSVSENEALSVANLFMKSDTETRSLPPISSITPFSYNNVVVLYVGNFSNDQGYILIPASKNSYPIYQYNKSGKFNYENFSDKEKEEFNNTLKELYDRFINNGNTNSPHYNDNKSLWKDISESLEPIVKGDSTIYTEIEFILPNPINDETPTRGMDDRGEPSGRKTIMPLYGYASKVYWHGGSPYNYDFPQYFDRNKNKKLDNNVPEFILAATYLHYYKCCENHIKFPYPHIIQESQESSPFSRYLYDFAKACNFVHYAYYRAEVPYPKDLSKTMEKMTGYPNSGRLAVYARHDDTKFSEAKIDTIYQSLLKKRPVMVFKDAEGYANFNTDATVIDGYAEMRVKVIKKKYLFNLILVGKKTYHYYRDFFSTISLSRHDRNGFREYLSLFEVYNHPYNHFNWYYFHNYDLNITETTLSPPRIGGLDYIPLSINDRFFVYQCHPVDYGSPLEYEWETSQEVSYTLNSTNKLLSAQFPPGIGTYEIKCRIKLGMNYSPWTTKIVKVMDVCPQCQNKPCTCPVDISMSITNIGSSPGYGDISVSNHMIMTEDNSHAGGCSISLSPGTYTLSCSGTPENSLYKTFTVVKDEKGNYTPQVINIQYDERNWHVLIR